MVHANKGSISFEDFQKQVINDYSICYASRQVSTLGRKDVLSGKARFAILGDGKELPQVVLSKFFQPGDFRCGYYRDQTWALASGIARLEDIFAQVYADSPNDPFSMGRQMSNHFATRFIDEDGNNLSLTELLNSTSDLGPVASQLPRALGIALASKLFRENPDLKKLKNLSRNGNEVCFCSIGDASTSEGHFFEVVNAAGVLQVPLVIFVWDDGYGISVDKAQQTTKGSISEILAGFQKMEHTNGLNIRSVKGWDYPEMCLVFEEVIQQARVHHIPAVIHVEELTQPFGHSSSGSHERYKSKERLSWEAEWDGVKKMRNWIIDNEILSNEALQAKEAEVEQQVLQAKDLAWARYYNYIEERKKQCEQLTHLLIQETEDTDKATIIQNSLDELNQRSYPTIRHIIRHIHHLRFLQLTSSAALSDLFSLEATLQEQGKQHFNTYLYNNENAYSLDRLSYTAAVFSQEELNGYEVLNRYFDQLFKQQPLMVALGEDVGKIGDVNKAFDGLQAKYSDKRVRDTGIRELSIMGQGIGLALRGLRPIAEIQYLDYLLYGLQPLSDDAATLYYRTAGKQACPLIVRTRGHRLVGIFHSGSPMQMMLGSLRGMFLCVPRNMAQAVGMYNTILKTNTPAIVVECLNQYRRKELVPKNLLEFSLPLGMPEILCQGTDITIVTYGSTLHLVLEAVALLQRYSPVSCEVIDAQTLLPFDTQHIIGASLKKTGKILFIDEDFPGGATAYMMQEVVEKQNGYRYLDAAPRTLTAQAHRPAHGSDGDYFSKPNTETIMEAILSLYAE